MNPDKSYPMRSATRTLIMTGLVCAFGTVSLETLSIRDVMRSNTTNVRIVECVVDGDGTITGPKSCSDTIMVVRGS